MASDTEIRIDAGNGGDSARQMRIALYSHDATGVGHVRRNMLIAQSLSLAPNRATSLVICGVHEATAFQGGHGVDCLTLPSFQKYGNDDYRPRNLMIGGDDVSAIRSEILGSCLSAMRPDLFIVDKVPNGIRGELTDVLPRLRQQGTRIVFGMRDILDDSRVIAEEWARNGYEKLIREQYDQVWVYGDPEVYDPVAEYGFSFGNQVRYCGYLDQRERLPFSQNGCGTRGCDDSKLRKTVLCMVGGGEDGVALATSFVQSKLPAGRVGLLITGPLMGEEHHRRIQEIAAARTDMEVVRQVADADSLVSRVEKVICMGGYNSLLSVVSFEKEALIVPRVHPRTEQLIRSELFQQRGLVDVLLPDQLTASALTEWMARRPQKKADRATVDLCGLKRIASFVQELCRPQSASANGRTTSTLSGRTI